MNISYKYTIIILINNFISKTMYSKHIVSSTNAMYTFFCFCFCFFFFFWKLGERIDSYGWYLVKASRREKEMH